MSETHNTKNCKIGTHDGTFHCDEVMACFMLKQLPEFRDAEIVRSRNPEILAQCDVVVDVGGVYDHKTRRYDHHQRDFKETLNTIRPSKEYSVKLSSAGLVYAHYGEEIIKQILDPQILTDDQVDQIYDKIYELVQEIDAIDNGVSICDNNCAKVYRITSNLSTRVSNLNPHWNETSPDITKSFYTAFELVGKEFVSRIKYFADVWLPARAIVAKAVEDRNKESYATSVIITLNTLCPWASHLYDLEKEMNIDPEIKYAIFKDSNDSWRVRAVTNPGSSFDLRLALPEEWRGVRDQELSELTGIPGCIFVHANGFIGGNKTYEGAYEMALKAIELGKNEVNGKNKK